MPIRSILFWKTGVNEGNTQTDKTNPEDLKIKDLLFMIISIILRIYSEPGNCI
jgi:hypothetical protein